MGGTTCITSVEWDLKLLLEPVCWRYGLGSEVALKLSTEEMARLRLGLLANMSC